MRSSIRRVIHCALFLVTSLTASAHDKDIGQRAMRAASSGREPVHIPADGELEQRGARIGEIQIAVEDVFERSPSLSAPYRVVNSLHISTHIETVNQHLLFRPGDKFDRRVLSETERLLRDQRYLADPCVEPLRYNDDNTVDVLVRVRDVWTMNPSFSFGREGGENSTEFEFEDTNFLGFGKTISVERSENVDRGAWRLGYADPHVFGSWWKLAVAHSALSDGSSDEFSFGQPFYSLDSRWSAAVSALDSELITPLYSLGKQVGRFETKTRTFGVSGGISKGLIDGWTTRYLFGLRYDARSFADATSDVMTVTPEDHRYTYPYFGMQWIEDSYVTARNLNQIGRTEDLHLGRSLTVTGGVAPTVLGSTSNAIMLTTRGDVGFDLGNEQYFIGGFDFTSRIESRGVRNGVFDVGGQYYRRQSEHRVIFAGLHATYTSHLDADTQLLLGGDSGLRGYPLRYQAGTSRAVLTLEQRFYTDWQPLKLVNVGAAVFADSGRMWGRDPYAVKPSGWLTDVGVGLRLGSARSGLGSILHVDVAIPLNPANEIDSMQFLIETKKSF